MSRYASKVVTLAKSCVGIKEGSNEHKKIIDTYNSYKPLARGYKMKYTDAWCSCFVSYVSIKLGYTGIIPTEVGCGKHIELFKKINSYVEDDKYVPKPGDIIFYDWKDDGKGENIDGASHVGIVISEPDKNKQFKVVEGNYNNKVDVRTFKVNARYIRGYGVPKYNSEVSESVPKPSEPKTIIHKVVKGDALYKLAKKYNTTVYKIYNANKKLIDTENKKRGISISKKWIYPGQKLVIK